MCKAITVLKFGFDLVEFLFFYLFLFPTWMLHQYTQETWVREHFFSYHVVYCQKTIKHILLNIYFIEYIILLGSAMSKRNCYPPLPWFKGLGVFSSRFSAPMCKEVSQCGRSCNSLLNWDPLVCLNCYWCGSLAPEESSCVSMALLTAAFFDCIWIWHNVIFARLPAMSSGMKSNG